MSIHAKITSVAVAYVQKILRISRYNIVIRTPSYLQFVHERMAAGEEEEAEVIFRRTWPEISITCSGRSWDKGDTVMHTWLRQDSAS